MGTLPDPKAVKTPTFKTRAESVAWVQAKLEAERAAVIEDRAKKAAAAATPYKPVAKW
jgi:hypothetical protein